jgi:hypothetical protein
MPAARRNGYAEEASRAIIRWARDTLGWREVETHMVDQNQQRGAWPRSSEASQRRGKRSPMASSETYM